MPTLATLADLDNRVLINRIAAVEGPLLLSLGGLHGNEPAGVHALMRIERAFENNVAFLKKEEFKRMQEICQHYKKARASKILT
jgi:hypothetical protein